MKGLTKLGLVVGSVIAFAALAHAADLTSTQRQIMQLEAFPNVELNDKIADTIDDAGAAVGSLSISVAAEGTNEIIVSLTFKDVRGSTKAARAGVLCYTSSDSAGDTPAVGFEGFNGLYKAGTDAVGSVMILGTNMRLVIP